jgi:hypothetical protein
MLRAVFLVGCILITGNLAQAQQQPTGICEETEPWGRYSASGGRHEQYLYSFGGDTSAE